MGYRKLLKGYMQHIDAVLGSDLVELAAMTNALRRREIGELRAIAAELKRESFDDKPGTDYDRIVHFMLKTGQIRVEQLAGIDGLEVGDEDEPMSPEAFRRILLTLLEFAAEDDNTEASEESQRQADPADAHTPAGRP